MLLLTIFNWFRKHNKVAAFCFYTWAAIIFAACLIPGKDVPSLSIFQHDKLIHFGIFALLAFLFLLLFKNPRLKREGLWVLLFSIAYGYFVEILQGSGLTKGRSFDHYDALADSIGGMLGVIIFFLMKYWADQSESNRKA